MKTITITQEQCNIISNILWLRKDQIEEDLKKGIGMNPADANSQIYNIQDIRKLIDK